MNRGCRRAIFAAGLALVCAGSTPADAAERCRRGLVVTGDFIDDVVRKCGQPVSVSNRWKRVNGGYDHYGHWLPERDVLVELLTFDLGYGRFRQTMKFEDGVLTSIRRGERSE